MTQAMTFEQRIKALAAELDSATYVHARLDEAVRLLELIPELFPKIAHGEQGHRDWLEQAIAAHFDEKPMPDYVAK